LRGMDAAVGEDLLVQRGHRSRRLSESRAVTGKRLQFHGSHVRRTLHAYAWIVNCITAGSVA
jgi:hypothetical protein